MCAVLALTTPRRNGGCYLLRYLDSAADPLLPHCVRRARSAVEGAVIGATRLGLRGAGEGAERLVRVEPDGRSGATSFGSAGGVETKNANIWHTGEKLANGE